MILFRPFKVCTNCKTRWRQRRDFLSDPNISLVGYQVNYTRLKAGLFLFNHSCGTTLALPAGVFRTLRSGRIFRERATGTGACPGFCQHEHELEPCVARCECAFVRDVLQLVRNWPKKPLRPIEVGRHGRTVP